MSEKRFVAEQVDVVNEDETEVWDVVFDTENTYAFMVRDTDTASDLCDLLNEQQNIIDILLECLYVAEDTVINEYSSHIAADMEKLDKIFKDRDIGEIRKFVLGDDSGRI